MTATTTETTSLIALTLPGTPYSVRMARFYVRAALSYHDLGDYAQDAEAVASELVTNAIEHAGAPCIGLELTLLDGSGALAVVVSDHSPHPPVMCEAQDAAERGYGLRMVAALSAHWGWTPRDVGKVVYAILSRKRQPMEAISEPPMLNDIDAGLLALSASRGKAVPRPGKGDRRP